MVRFLIFNTTGLRRHKTNFKCPVQGLTRQWVGGGGGGDYQFWSGQVRSGQCLTATFRASCCNARGIGTGLRRFLCPGSGLGQVRSGQSV